jgi:hypothetical protein
MAVGNRGGYQSWILSYPVQLNGPVTIHAFGGRGSPVVSSAAA